MCVCVREREERNLVNIEHGNAGPGRVGEEVGLHILRGRSLAAQVLRVGGRQAPHDHVAAGLMVQVQREEQPVILEDGRCRSS